MRCQEDQLLICFASYFPFLQFNLTAAAWLGIEASDLARIIAFVWKIMWKLKSLLLWYLSHIDYTYQFCHMPNKGLFDSHDF
jgi:hypothetical protein